MQSRPIEPGRGTVAGRVLLEGKPVHIPDVQADPGSRYQGGVIFILHDSVQTNSDEKRRTLYTALRSRIFFT
jgi:hypothetical protein